MTEVIHIRVYRTDVNTLFITDYITLLCATYVFPENEATYLDTPCAPAYGRETVRRQLQSITDC